jgi:HEAT repeat protein
MDKVMNDMEETLNLLMTWKEHLTEIDYSIMWRKAHALAENEFPAAKDFFVQGLNDPNWRWRDDCISFLGFHYLLENDILKKIRNLLLFDPNSNVRISAASVLGKQSSLPDPALISAIMKDSNHLVRESAFEAILALAGVSIKKINREIKRLRTGEIQAALSEVKRITEEEKINLPKHLFD